MTYEVIPWAPRYEVDQTGRLRNRETGKQLKWFNQCRAYLAEYCGLAPGTARQYFYSRKTEIAGWKVQYLD